MTDRLIEPFSVERNKRVLVLKSLTTPIHRVELPCALLRAQAERLELRLSLVICDDSIEVFPARPASLLELNPAPDAEHAGHNDLDVALSLLIPIRGVFA